jgi:hypothetical protein
MTIKKIVIREGIIIAALCILFWAILFVFPRYAPKDKPSKTYNETELVELGVMGNGVGLKQAMPPQLTSKILAVDETTRKNIARTILFNRKKIFLKRLWTFKAENLYAHEDLRKLKEKDLAWVGDVSLEKMKALERPSFFWTHFWLNSYFVAFSLFPLYLLYLVFQFIIWANKKRNPTNKFKPCPKCGEKNNPALNKCWKCKAPL